MIKRCLYLLLGPAAYLRVVSSTFFFLFRGGWLKRQPAFFNHYMAEQLVQPGDHVIDIGANLGYYTVLFADRAGESGKVYAVEPVELFRGVLRKNLAWRNNVEILGYALGMEDGKEIEMGIPAGHKNFRHGLTHVLNKGEKTEQTMVFKALMRHPAALFGAISRLDYVKCDVEGYETQILPLMEELFRKFQPIVQLETGGENRKLMMRFFYDLGYRVFAAGEKHLHPLMQAAAEAHNGDLLFIPGSRMDSLKNIIKI